MSLVIMMQTIPAKQLSIGKLKGNILNAQLDNKADLTRYLNMTTATWDGEKPVMDVKVVFAGGGIIVVGGPADNGSHGTKKWHWLNSGTRIRYATMKTGFQAKTRTGRVSSMDGGGEVAYINRKVPRPGIKARRWNYYIPRLMRPRFVARIQNAIRQGLS